MTAPGPYFLRGLLVALTVFCIDRASKTWILYGLNLEDVGTISVLPFFSLTMVWNRSISMGLPIDALTGQTGLILLTGLITLILLVWLYRTAKFFEAAALMLVIGGAAGNVIDRLVHGAVVDFIHLHAFDYSFYVFNLADAAITCGVVLLLLDSFMDSKQGRPES